MQKFFFPFLFYWEMSATDNRDALLEKKISLKRKVFLLWLMMTIWVPVFLKKHQHSYLLAYHVDTIYWKASNPFLTTIGREELVVVAIGFSLDRDDGTCCPAEQPRSRTGVLMDLPTPLAPEPKGAQQTRYSCSAARPPVPQPTNAV